MNLIRIGTRGSKLALWQANYVAGKLLKGGWNTQVVTVDTKGDKILDVSVSKIGSKGVFTEEIEEKLRTGEIDIAVHSAKDLQSTLAEDLEIIAFSEREDPSDVLVSDRSVSIDSPITIGTSSTRRVGLLRHFYPHVKIVPMRGNLQTRFEKMKNGHCDAMILAAAGVKRMGYQKQIAAHMEISKFIPPAGQGAIAIEVGKSLNPKIKEAIKNLVNNSQTEWVVNCEREYLKVLNGGCSIPVYAHAFIDNGKIKITAGICSLDGEEIIIDSMSAKMENSAGLGEKLGRKILESGGESILRQIRKDLKN